MKKKQTTFSCQNMTASRIHCMFITFYAVTFESSVAYFCLFCCYLLFIFAVIFCCCFLYSHSYICCVVFLFSVLHVYLCFQEVCVYVLHKSPQVVLSTLLQLFYFGFTQHFIVVILLWFYLALYCSYFTLVLLSTLLQLFYFGFTKHFIVVILLRLQLLSLACCHFISYEKTHNLPYIIPYQFLNPTFRIVFGIRSLCWCYPNVGSFLNVYVY